MIWLDIGLVNVVNEYYGGIIRGDYAGGVMEQVVGQTLLVTLAGTLTKLVYYAKDRDKGSAEVDFCFLHHGRLIAMEVKAGKSVFSRSLHNLYREYKNQVVPVLVSWEEMNAEQDVFRLPFYLLERWEELMSDYPPNAPTNIL